MTNERLEEIAARVNAATPGPWLASTELVGALVQDITDGSGELFCCVNRRDDTDENREKDEADAAFIANAREDVLSLLEEVRRLKAPLFKRVTRMAEVWRLTKREAEVLELLVQAYTNKDIGVRLGIADSTVEIHVSRVIHKSKCASRAEVIVAAYTGVVP